MSAGPVAPRIRFDAVSRRFGETVALEALDLTVEPGGLVCLLGPNGAGKTTAMRTIMGLERPSSGEMWIDGVPATSRAVHARRRRIGYMAEEPLLYDELTGREFLRFILELHGIAGDIGSRIAAGLESMAIGDEADRRVRTYSMGMRKKIAFLAATLPDPVSLVFDEPTGGLDAVSARVVKEVMVRYRDRGGLVLFSTHVMEIAERWADRIAILDRGRLIFHGTVDGLRRRRGRPAGASQSLEELFLDVTGRG